MTSYTRIEKNLWKHRWVAAVFAGTLLAGLVLVLVLKAGSAQALPCETCTGGTHQETVRATLSVTNNQPAQGKVTSSDSQINCGLGGATCSKTYNYIVTCDNTTGDCTTPTYTTVNLSTSQASGYSFLGWGGVCSGPGSCSVLMDSDKSVSASFGDVTNPTVTLTSPASNTKVGSSFTAAANANDGAGIARVEFLVDGLSQGQADTSPPYSASINALTISEGAHTVSARATDVNGRQSTSSATNVTVDKHTTVTLVDPTPAQDSSVNDSPVQVAFTTDSDVTAANIQCKTTVGTTVGAFAQCSSPYTVPTSGDGPYKVEVKATDDVGNTQTAPRNFTLDTAAPTATGGPTGTRVSRRTNITAMFSEAMKKATVESRGTFTLRKKGTTRSLGAAVVYSEPTATTFKAVLNPSRNLKPGATYIATVSSAATDLAGNPLVKKTWKFTVRS